MLDEVNHTNFFRRWSINNNGYDMLFYSLMAQLGFDKEFTELVLVDYFDNDYLYYKAKLIISIQDEKQR